MWSHVHITRYMMTSGLLPGHKSFTAAQVLRSTRSRHNVIIDKQPSPWHSITINIAACLATKRRARVVWSVHEFFVSVLIAPDRRHFLLYYTSGPSGTPAHYPLVPSASRRLGKEGKLQSRLLVLWLKAKSETRMETFREDETEM